MLIFANDGAYDAQLRGFTDAYVGNTGLTGDEFFALAKGIIGRESRFVPTAYHFDGPDPALNASYGLMQVEGVTAKAYGYTGPVTGLYDAGTNMLLGVRLLADNLATASGSVPAAVSAYNAGFSTQRPGDGQRLADGTFVNQGYVNDVLSYMAQYLAQVQGLEGTTGTGTGALGGSALGWALVALAVGGLAVAVVARLTGPR